MREPWDIAVDLDGVVYDFVEVFAAEARLSELAHVRVPEDPRPTRWDFYRSWGLTPEEFAELFVEGVRQGRVFWEGPTYPGVHEGWQALSRQGHRIHVITDRSPVGAERESQEATVSWLEAQGFEVASLTITADKGSALQEIVVDPSRALFIDDKPDNIRQGMSAGIPSVLMDQPWNAEFGHPRVRSFSQFAALVADECRGRGVLSGLPGMRLGRRRDESGGGRL